MKSKSLVVWHYNQLLFWNGGTKFVHMIASQLVKQYRVVVAANTTDKAVVKRFTDIGVEVVVGYRWPRNVYLHRIMMPLGILIDAIKLRSWWKQSDYVVATAFPSNVVCGLARIMFGTRFSYYCFEPTVMFFDQGFINEKSGMEKWQWMIAARIYGLMDTWAVKQASVVMTLNPTTASQIKKVYGVEAKVTQVGVDTSVFYPRKNNQFKKKYLGRKIIAHSTDYQPEKRLDVVIRAFAKVVKKHPEALLLVTSTNPNSPNKLKYQAMIKSLGLEDQVKLLGFIDYQQIPELYSTAVCYLSTASGLQYGVTSSNLPVKEAMACGTPAIRAPVINEDVEDGVSGYMVDPTNERLLIQKLLILLEKDELRLKMGQAAREKVVESFQWEKVVKRFKTYWIRNRTDD